MAESNFRISVRLLCTKRFGTFWFASLLANIGTWAQQVAQPWLLLTLGASSFLVGLDAFALGAPVLLLTLVGGVLADHADRRRIIAVFQSIQMLCPVVLVALLLAGILRPWEVIVISLVVGITDALSMPSFQTIVPSIVERQQLSAGLALNSMQFNLSRILGPSLAGVLMASVGAIACFMVSAASYAPFIFVALWILPHGRITRPAGEKTGARHPFSGIREITRHPDLRGALLTVVVTSLLCGPLITFIPVLVKDVFHGDVRHYSMAAATFGAGGLLGAAALLFVDASQDLRRWNTWFARGFGVVLVAAALNPWLWAVPVLTMLAGATMTLSNTLANSRLQFSVAAHFRGQTSSLFMLAMRGGLALGSLLTGLSASLVGVRYALLINGLLAVLMHAAIGWQWLRLAPPETSR